MEGETNHVDKKHMHKHVHTHVYTHLHICTHMYALNCVSQKMGEEDGGEIAELLKEQTLSDPRWAMSELRRGRVLKN